MYHILEIKLRDYILFVKLVFENANHVVRDAGPRIINSICWGKLAAIGHVIYPGTSAVAASFIWVIPDILVAGRAIGTTACHPSGLSCRYWATTRWRLSSTVCNAYVIRDEILFFCWSKDIITQCNSIP